MLAIEQRLSESSLRYQRFIACDKPQNAEIRVNRERRDTSVSA